MKVKQQLTKHPSKTRIEAENINKCNESENKFRRTSTDECRSNFRTKVLMIPVNNRVLVDEIECKSFDNLSTKTLKLLKFSANYLFSKQI